MNYRNPISKMGSFLSKQELDHSSLGNLLDQFKSPCLIWDKFHNKILQVNNEFISLTGFTREELNLIRIDSLIQDFNLIDIPDKKMAVDVKRKNRTSVKCLLNLISLNDQGNLMLMDLNSLIFNNKILTDNNSLLQCILDLVLFSEIESIDEYLIETLNKLKLIYDCNNICIYISENTNQILKKKKTTEFVRVFPDEIPLSEISLSETMDVWKPGKRVLSVIHRAARINKIATLIQVPLNINNNITGLIVLDSKDELDTERTYEQLPVMAQIIKVNLEKKYKEKANSQEYIEKNNRAFILDCILNNIKLGIMIIDKGGRIIEINSYLEKILGFSKWEIINNSASLVLPDSLFKAKNNKSEIQFISDKDFYVNLHRRDGSEFPTQLQFLPLNFTEDKNEDAVLLAVIYDLSTVDQLRMKNKQLERQAEMGVMVASFAHDMRNVFNSIKLSAETVESKSDLDQSIQEYAENIKEDCDRINQLMESVLSFSSSIEDNLQTLDIIFLLQQLIERWNPKLERAKVKCVLQFEKEVPLISADPRSLEQVFNNLFSNARDAMDQTGGTLGVYISKKESKVGSRTVVIKISDSGPGIPEEFKTKIFDPYFSSRPGGTGLGLAITKRIVELHHGQIEVDSFPGGTTFAVTFPEKSTEITNQ